MVSPGRRFKADSETNGDSETAIQKLRFRNYFHRFRNYCDSETNALQKLRFRNYRDSETIAIQKLWRFRNYGDSETAIQKLQFRNYRDSETIAIQKLYRDYQDFAQGSDDIKIPTPMELQIDLDFTQGSDDITIPTSMELHV